MSEWLWKFEKRWQWWIFALFLLSHLLLPRFFVTYFWLFLIDFYFFTSLIYKPLAKVEVWRWYHKTVLAIGTVALSSLWVFLFIFVLSIWSSVK